MHEVLVNRLGGLSLPRKSVVRLTDRPDMTLDVYRGRKTTIQQHCFFQAVLRIQRKEGKYCRSCRGGSLCTASFASSELQIQLSYTVIILNIGTDRSEQTVQTQIRLLLMEQSDQGLLCLLFCLHLLSTILHCKIQLFQW